MGFWDYFWIFVPPVVLVIIGVVYYFLTSRSGRSKEML
jgi:hypothetical protein